MNPHKEGWAPRLVESSCYGSCLPGVFAAADEDMCRCAACLCPVRAVQEQTAG